MQQVFWQHLPPSYEPDGELDQRLPRQSLQLGLTGQLLEPGSQLAFINLEMSAQALDVVIRYLGLDAVVRRDRVCSEPRLCGFPV